MVIWRYRRHGIGRFTGTQQRGTLGVPLVCFTSIRFMDEELATRITGLRRDR